MTDVTQAPPQFVSLCKALYGDVVDPDVVWSVAKLSPGPSDVHANAAPNGTRRNIERASNAVGITAGSLGLASALKDERLDPEKNPEVGRVGRTLHATGKKMPSILGRIKSKKVQAALAAGAVGTQVLNLGGDALIAGTLGEKPKKSVRHVKHGQGQLVAKASIQGALFDLPKGVQEAAAGLRQTWNKAAQPLANHIRPAMGTSKKPPMAQSHLPGMSPGGASQSPLPGLGQVNLPNAPTKSQTFWRNTGSNLMGGVGTKEGKTGIAIGAAGTMAVGGANRRRKERNAMADYGYAKRDDEIVFKGEFSKFDDDKHQAFGWASVVKKDGSPVLDKQGDYISIEDLEDAAYTYVHKSRVGGDMHKRDGEAPHKVSDMIESMVFTPEKIAKMGLPQGFPEGWWVGYQIHDEDTWQEVRKRGRTGFSIHGRGIRKDMDMDELMGYR